MFERERDSLILIQNISRAKPELLRLEVTSGIHRAAVDGRVVISRTKKSDVSHLLVSREKAAIPRLIGITPWLVWPIFPHANRDRPFKLTSLKIANTEWRCALLYSFVKHVFCDVQATVEYNDERTMDKNK